MSRLIEWPELKEGPEEPGAVAGTGGEPDSWLERVGNMVPAEVTAFYLAASKLIEGGASKLPTDLLLWVAFGAGLLAAPLYVRKLGKDKKKPWKTQAAVTAIAFVVWAYALVGPFRPWHDNVVAGLVLLLFSLFSGLGVRKPLLD